MTPSTLAEMIADKPLHIVAPSDSIRIACILMTSKRVGALPVVNADGRLVGILSERDVIRRSVIVYRPSEETPVSAIMTAEPQWLPPHASPSEAMERMAWGGFRHLPVCEDRQILGMVSIRDLAWVDAEFDDVASQNRKIA